MNERPYRPLQSRWLEDMFRDWEQETHHPVIARKQPVHASIHETAETATAGQAVSEQTSVVETDTIDFIEPQKP